MSTPLNLKVSSNLLGIRMFPVFIAVMNINAIVLAGIVVTKLAKFTVMNL